MYYSEDDVEPKTVQIAVIGEPKTGKSCLCHRYLGGNSLAPSGGTQGAEVMAGQCVGLRPAVPLQLCDVAGNALQTHMLANYLYASDIILFVYDLTNLQSFEKLKEWIRKVKEIFENEMKRPLMALFGNKSDLEHQRAVRLSCVQKFASEHLLENFKGSARTGDMVSHAFTSLVARALGLKVHRLPPTVVDGRSLAPKELELNGHAHSEPMQPLIMNRKALRRVQRKASSTICNMQ
ncbi:ras-related protein Rab-28-like [Helicoverpa zea]|uniref:ras-related protein Rab-28-like n=1 Tax=Helicoverpa zea TaxID=7113 RepID=UPI001F5AB19D|nr:ras-related protein Rab-28-like [Helicoverpa zea]